MLAAITLLLVYQTIGASVVQSTALPVSGPVVDMALLFISLVLRGAAPAALTTTAQRLPTHLSLLCVTAGVGVRLHFERLRAESLPITVTLLVSTVLTIAVTALVMQALRRADHSSDQT